MIHFNEQVYLCSLRGIIARLHRDAAERVFSRGQALIQYRDRVIAVGDAEAEALARSKKRLVVSQLFLPDLNPGKDKARHIDSRYTTETESFSVMRMMYDDEGRALHRRVCVTPRLTVHKDLDSSTRSLYQLSILENLKRPAA